MAKTHQIPAIDDLLTGVGKISGNRDVLVRLNRLLDDDDSGPVEMLEILRLDPGLCARVIAASNTVFFRGGSPVLSIDEAVIRVGGGEIRRLLLESICYEMMAGPLKYYGIVAGELWDRSLGCAISMSLLGAMVQRSSDVCYTIGLLHAVGMVVVDRWLEANEPRRQACFSGIPEPDLWSNEREVVGSSNPEVGAALLNGWSFPESITLAIAGQANSADSGRFVKLASLLAIARWHSASARARLAFSKEPDFPEASVFECAGVDAEQARETVGEVSQQLVAAKDLVFGS